MNNRLVPVVALIVGVVVGVLTMGFRAETEKANYTLKDTAGQCGYDFKQDAYVTRGNNLKFSYKSTCASEVTVAIGNLRTVPSTTAIDCTKATDGVSWPFKAADEDLTKRQTGVPAGGHGSFVIHGATTSGEYYFSVCIGNKVVDPRLVIE